MRLNKMGVNPTVYIQLKYMTYIQPNNISNAYKEKFKSFKDRGKRVEFQRGLEAYIYELIDELELETEYSVKRFRKEIEIRLINKINRY